jgi:hypothetical protein
LRELLADEPAVTVRIELFEPFSHLRRSERRQRLTRRLLR